VYTGLARVLQAREDVVPGGWDNMLLSINQLIPMMESQVDVITDPEGLAFLGNSLARLYHVLFNYHDSKTKDADSAWESLSKAYHYKMSNLPPWNTGFEAQKIQATKQIFHAGFWPKVGSQSDVPIFIIGFVRSGSTLLERILDAHPDIVGTGENSVFNGQLDRIRIQIVKTSLKGDTDALEQEIERLADEVVEEMKNRWDMVAAGEERAAGRRSPRKYVDKMLTNYYSKYASLRENSHCPQNTFELTHFCDADVGFIHMLFPKALILHVIREPMDTLFSAYKHEFPPGTLDYTSLFDSLAELYHGKNNIIFVGTKEIQRMVVLTLHFLSFHQVIGM
jgi:lysozyme family protein